MRRLAAQLAHAGRLLDAARCAPALALHAPATRLCRHAHGGWRQAAAASLRRSFASLPALDDVTSTDASAGARHIRDFAIIAHVDHGKTTLMDKLMRECDGDAAAANPERTMDSLSLERERGITIQAKYTSMPWRGRTLNAVDTPGHADFGGEVERVLGMVDGAVLLVDAAEGPLAQTKFVVSKAVARGLRPILVLNKVDRDAVTEQRCTEIMSQVFDLFAALGATDEQLDFPILYASARMGWAADSWEAARAALAGQPHSGMAPLLDAVVRHVPQPAGDADGPFQMVVSMMERDAYLGRVVTGRVASGRARVGDSLRALVHEGGGAVRADGRVTRILKRRGGAGRITLAEARVGDIVSIAGIPGAVVTDTLAAPEVTVPLPAVAVDPPTLSMVFSVNDSPLAGRDGTQLTGNKIGTRLASEAESNVSITLKADARGGEAFEVQGRGELQLGVLIENMRREGFELSVSPPEVLLRTGPDGKLQEPVEALTVEVDEAHAGPVIDALSLRGAEVLALHPGAGEAGRSRVELRAPTRGLLGFRPQFATLTRGGGVMQRAFDCYAPLNTGLTLSRKGAMVSMTDGTATGFALAALEERGTLFVAPGAALYSGMVVGECARGGDLEVNPAKEKKLTNIRNTGSEEQVRLTPPRRVDLEDAMASVRADELIEVTPKAVRLRKRELDANARKSGLRRKSDD